MGVDLSLARQISLQVRNRITPPSQPARARAPFRAPKTVSDGARACGAEPELIELFLNSESHLAESSVLNEAMLWSGMHGLIARAYLHFYQERPT